METKNTKLPWHLWSEILGYVGFERRDLRFVNKTWFDIIAGKMATLIFDINIPNQIKQHSPLFNHNINKAVFSRDSNIDWELYNQYPNIRKVCISSKYIKDFSYIFYANLWNNNVITNLNIDLFGGDDLSLNSISFIRSLSQQLIVLQLNITSESKNCCELLFKNIQFSRLKELILESSDFKIETNSLSPAIPHIHSSGIILKQGQILNLAHHPKKITRINQLEIGNHKNNALDSFTLDLAPFPNLKKLDIQCKINFKNTNSLFKSNINNLVLKTKPDNFSRTWYQHFPLLKIVTYTPQNFKRSDFKQLSQLFNQISTLTIDFAEVSIKDLPRGNFTITHLKIQRCGYLTNSFIQWLANNFALTHLEIQYDKPTCETFSQITFNHLEYVQIEASYQTVQQEMDTLFSIENHPQLKTTLITDIKPKQNYYNY